MLAPMQTWLNEKPVVALLASIRPSDFAAGTVQMIVGPDAPVWKSSTWRGHRVLIVLEKLRTKYLDAKYGTFADAWAEGGEVAARMVVDAHEATPSVQDALQSVLGNPLYARRAA